MFKTLQMGRALASLAVCAFHLSLAFSDRRYGGQEFLPDYLRFGWHGVDFFFALSGFIIMYAHHGDIGRPEALGRYASKRFVRIYPMYWLLTAMVVALSLLAARLPAAGVGDTVGDTASTVLLWRFTPVATPLLPAWTLFHEVFFYCVFALLIMNRAVGLLAACLWIAAILLWGETRPLYDRSLLSLVIMPLNLCFFGGMAAYYFYRRLPLSAAYCFIGLGIFILCATLAVGATGQRIFSLAMALAFFLLLSGVTSLELYRRIPDLPWLSLLGSASYTLYLAHAVLQAPILKSFYALGLFTLVGRTGVFALTLATTTGVAVGIYLCMERPLLQFLGGQLNARLQPRSPA